MSGRDYGGQVQQRFPLDRFAGFLLLLLGAVVMLAWWLRLEQPLRLSAQFTPMVFSTALCFVLAGAALVWRRTDAARHASAMGVLGAALVAIATWALLQRALQLDLGLDLPSLHRWLQEGHPSPGRMSAGTATAFLMSGLALFIAPRASRRRTGTLVRALTLAVGGVGVLGMAGYLVSAPLLFPQYLFAGVALHTAVGLVLLAAGLHSACGIFEWGRARMFARDDDRITFIAAAVLGAVTLAAGVATFAILQDRVQTLVRNDLLASLARRADVFRDMIELREGAARIAANRPAATRNLRVIRSGRDDGSNLANLEAVVASFVGEGFSAVAYRDADGKVAASGGRFVAAPALVVSLSTPHKAELLWSDGFLLRHRIAMSDAEGRVGEVLVEQPLPVLTRLATDARGRTWDMGLCVRRAEQLWCFPQLLNPTVFSTPLVNSAGDPLPMARALRGETATVITRDYRAQNVVAAYGPIGELGLGMVVKVDAAEIFQPIREQMQLAAGLLLLLVAGGTLLLRSQVKPLASELDARVRERTAQLDEALSKLGESEQHYRMLFDANPHPMWVHNVDTLKFLAVNDAAIRHYGYSREEFAKMTVLDLRSIEGREKLRTLIGSLHGDTFHRGIHEHRKKDGRRIHVDVASNGILFEGRPARLVLAHDVTEKRRAEREIQQLNAELEERVRWRTSQLEAANKELEAFSYSVSHDLRAPLRHISGFADALTEDCAPALDDTGNRYLRVIQDSVRQMGRLIDGLLAFSKMGRVDMRHERVDMDELVREVLGRIQPGAPGVEWRVHPLPPVMGDRVTLKQVWANLLDNAVKYSSKRSAPRVEVTGIERGDEIEFCVRDNGAGFDMAYVGKLFGVFQRLHKQEEFEGTGIGLANVRRIVERHGGRIRAEGTPGEGASFCFTLAKTRQGEA
jgi:PAS domain S-box-containing protein